MPDIEVNCGHCGNIFPVPEESGGLIATCPQCGQQVSVPLPAGGRSGGARLQVRRDTSADGTRPCPACGAPMAEEDIVCVECGYNVRTGRAPREEVPAKSRVLRWAILGAGLVILAGLARGIYQRRVAGPAEMPPPSESAPPAVAPVTEQPETIAPTPAEGIAEQVDVVETTGAEGESGEGQGEEGPDLVMLQKELRQRMHSELDQKLPLFKQGESVEVRRRSGRVSRGILTERRKDEVVLVAAGEVIEVPYKELDQTSRLRCDRQFRDQFVAYRVKVGMARLTRP